MEITSKLLQSLFVDLGIAVIPKCESDSPLCKLFHFNVCNIKDINLVEKQVETISKFLKTNLVYEESSVAHFALRLNKENRKLVDFAEEQYQSKINYDCEKLKVFAGIDAENNIICFDLKDMPHILIAGTTGSGKSVMLKSMICSLMLSEETILFDFIDTKRVELSKFKTIINSRFAPTYIDALEILADVCNEIENRYSALEQNPNLEFFSRIIVIDELNDLMMASKKTVEDYIVKIAQLGRSCGIYLIIATQRPVVSTLTGNIKANIDCRIALKTTSNIDSRNILGHGGAEKLNGKGDALLKLPTNSDEIHIQCPFISDSEIESIIDEYNSKTICVDD